LKWPTQAIPQQIWLRWELRGGVPTRRTAADSHVFADAFRMDTEVRAGTCGFGMR